MYNVVDQIRARELWDAGITGEGVHVAVIDTGVAPVAGLSGSDKVVAMVDLSFEADVPEAVFLDTNGHGTHMAGIIAGHTPGVDPTDAGAGDFFGVAPDAGIVSVKVGDNTGAVDVSQVIAAIDWVIQYGNQDGLNVRVINLSYGTDSDQPYQIDPLAHAVERAWNAGIVVVAAAGNEGWNGSGGLSNPASDPFVIAVAANEATSWGNTIPSWSSPGVASTRIDGRIVKHHKAEYEGRTPDVAAPGAHIDSLRAPGSRTDVEHPEGYVTETLFRGSGTSQSAAVVSGAVALMLEARPDLTPDEVKAMLMQSATPVRGYDPVFQGAGVIDVAAALAVDAAGAKQTWEASTGSGSLDAARGTQRVTINGEELSGEVTVNGASWSGASWSGASWSGASWSGASWSGASWSGASWSGASWSGASWSGASWSGASWSGASWSGASWSGASWSGASWSGASWSGASWSGASWSGASWSGASWSGASWG